VTLAATKFLSTARFSKVVRIFRAFRVMRLARLLKLPGRLDQITERILSETVVLVMGIAKSTCCVVGLAHYIACFWYKLGTLRLGEENWIQEHGVEEAPVLYKYLVSAHWAITQITGTMEVEAHNSGERIFSVLVLIVCFVLSAAFISNITTSMTRLQVIGAKQQSQFSILRRYLRFQGVSTRLAMRITRNTQFRLKQQQQRIAEGDVELIALLSEPLRVELHFEVYSKMLCAFRLFDAYCSTNPMAMRRVCHSAVSVASCAKGDVVFSTGERPAKPRMLFVTSGSLQYIQDNCPGQPVNPSNWLCEPVLWTYWTHQGVLRASTECEILSLDAGQFQRIAVYHFDLEDDVHPALYAKQFVDRINELGTSELTDFNLDLNVSRTFLASRRNSRTSMGSSLNSDKELTVLDRLNMIYNFRHSMSLGSSVSKPAQGAGAAGQDGQGTRKSRVCFAAVQPTGSG